MKIYIYTLLLSFSLFGCERSIMTPPPKVCDYNDYWLMQKPQELNPCELEYWENQQFDEKEIGYITFDDIDGDDE